jgi:glycerophosphoryl diester phosphodiesterase
MKIIAHRGARAHAPENTLAAFRKALEIGVDAIELDVFVLKSGELAVMHDILVNRTTDGEGYIEDFTYEEIRKLDAGQGEKVPTLNEVIELVNRSIPIMIELKSGGTGKAVAALLKEYFAKGWQPEDFEVISFNHHEVEAFRQDCAGVRIGASLVGIPMDYSAFATRVEAQSVMLCAEFLTYEFVQDAHDNGLTVNCFTGEPFCADTQSEVERIQALGVDGLVSDAPDRAKAFLK